MDRRFSKPIKVNKPKQQKILKDSGQQYLSTKGNLQPSRRKAVDLHTARANDLCSKQGKNCKDFTQCKLQNIQDSFWSLNNDDQRRQYISRHVKLEDIKYGRKGNNSRKQQRFCYALPNEHGLVVRVCGQLFLKTLNVSDKFVRNIFKHLDESGVIENESRGGRPKALANGDKKFDKKCWGI